MAGSPPRERCARCTRWYRPATPAEKYGPECARMLRLTPPGPPRRRWPVPGQDQDSLLDYLEDRRVTAEDRPTVQVDPGVRFGKPHVGGVSTEVLAEAVWAATGVDRVAEDFGLTRGQVLVACWYQTRHAWPARDWDDWARAAEAEMAKAAPDYAAIPDPSTCNDLP